ncbi:hypothetical protein Tco_0199570 [Tanacetum coccineum]
MVPTTTYLVGFSGEIIWPLGQVSLLLKIGDEEHSTSAWMNFMIVRLHSPYNEIIGRLGVRRIKAISSTSHGMLKFPVTGGTVTLWSSRIIPLECAMISGPRTQQPMVDQVTEEKIQVVIHPEYPEQTIAIGKRKGKAPERNKAIYEEVEKLVNANFKDLNKACPKDGYPLPEIDWKVESLCGYPFKCFLDAYKGYHQIKTAKEDEEKTAMKEGIFLGYKVNFDGLVVCLDKVEAVLSLPSPKCLKDVQRLNEKLASLNMFLSKSAERSLPFFKTLKKCTKKSDFQWTTEVETAFQQMKKSIAELPMMAEPQEKEE